MSKKYKIKLLTDEREALSHVFFNCADEHLEKIAEKHKSAQDITALQEREIEIGLTVGGYECDPKAFFDEMFEQFAEVVEKKATELLKEQTAGKLAEIQDKLRESEQVLGYWADNVNWQSPNPLKNE